MLPMTMNKYVLKFCYFFNSMVMNRALRFYPPNNVSVEVNFTCSEKAPPAKRSQKAGNTLMNPGAPEI